MLYRNAKNTIATTSLSAKIDKPTLYLFFFSFIAIVVSIFLPKWAQYKAMLFHGLIFSTVATGIAIYPKRINNKDDAFGAVIVFVVLYLISLAPVVIGFLAPAFIVWRVIKNIFPTVCIILLTVLFVLYLCLMIVLYPERLFDWLFFIQNDL